MNEEYTPEVSKILTVGTCNIDPYTAKMLESKNHPLIVYSKGDYGFLIYVGGDDTVKNLTHLHHHGQNCTIPLDLAILIGEARRLGCDWLVLDRDACDPRFQQWEW